MFVRDFGAVRAHGWVEKLAAWITRLVENDRDIGCIRAMNEATVLLGGVCLLLQAL